LNAAYVALIKNQAVYKYLMKQMEEKKVGNYKVGTDLVKLADIVTQAVCIRMKSRPMQMNQCK